MLEFYHAIRRPLVGSGYRAAAPPERGGKRRPRPEPHAHSGSVEQILDLAMLNRKGAKTIIDRTRLGEGGCARRRGKDGSGVGRGSMGGDR